MNSRRPISMEEKLYRDNYGYGCIARPCVEGRAEHVFLTVNTDTVRDVCTLIQCD